MIRTHSCFVTLGAALALTAPALAGGGLDSRPDTTPAARNVELAICLDTSGSMDGLIEAAKQKLWAVVNDLALAEPTPKLRVALLTFGNDGHDPEQGWVTVNAPLTDDLDLVSGKLFELTTNGGTEYVGRVLHYAGQLDWTPSEDTLKLAVVAGNESADQDQAMTYRDVCKTLISAGIMVNSIYCGPASDDLAPAWRDIAKLADGHFASIDKDHGTVVIETPFDDQLTDLSAKLNTTYLPYGAAGIAAAENQVAQDVNAATLNKAASATRCATKAGALYGCGSWDLVDACKAPEFDLTTITLEQLPENMRDMTPEERQTHVDAMARERAAIQTEVAEINAKRQAFVNEALKTQSLDESQSFDKALRNAIRAQAQARGFTFNEQGS